MKRKQFKVRRVGNYMTCPDCGKTNKVCKECERRIDAVVRRAFHPEARRTNGGYLEDDTRPTPMPEATRAFVERMRR